ncbi:AMP-binding enzyme [Cytobacillus purgationiresistens]|uniref:AMP-binding enzyme n=1 Tax=Cytobacillus purgationiresistens TaxID=863449 RepID=UPI0027D8AF86|nr:hypothetical protein [Cytobacillus purgationiresistens]
MREVLLKHKSINNATVCTMKIKGVSRIIGFYEMKSLKKKPKLHTYLKKSLPSYMIPMEIVMITKIPLTIGGKIDVNKLKEDYLNGK